MRALAVCAVLAATGFLAAQDKKDDRKPEPKGEEVAGTVTLKGQPIGGVTVTFVSKDGKATAAAATDDDGKYTAAVPVGEYGITLTPTEKGPRLPQKYGDPKTSGLTITVKAGKQSFDIRISP
jgi:hypothetical protein